MTRLEHVYDDEPCLDDRGEPSSLLDGEGRCIHGLRAVEVYV